MLSISSAEMLLRDVYKRQDYLVMVEFAYGDVNAAMIGCNADYGALRFFRCLTVNGFQMLF